MLRFVSILSEVCKIRFAKGYQKKYSTIDEINENGEKLFKLVELVTDDKEFPHRQQEAYLQPPKPPPLY